MIGSERKSKALASANRVVRVATQRNLGVERKSKRLSFKSNATLLCDDDLDQDDNDNNDNNDNN
jgi:hypothetical protein